MAGLRHVLPRNDRTARLLAPPEEVVLVTGAAKPEWECLVAASVWSGVRSSSLPAHGSWLGVLPLLAALASTTSVTSTAAAAPPETNAPLKPQPAGPSGDVSALVSSVQPAVVNITVAHVLGSRPGSNEDAPFEGKLVGAGSGFVIDDQGHVVTNAHVVDGADKVKVKLADERELVAKVLGKDDRLDVAVLQVEGAKDLPHVTLGSSTSLRVGEPVVAIGNPFGLGGTVTSGIVSAKGRAIGAGPYDDFLQTDASINPGSSGGPLFDLRGQVVGMNTAIAPNGQGIGFAIPSDAIRGVLPQLIEHGHVRRGKLGAQVQTVDEPLGKALGLGGTRGALVGDVERGGPGERAGLRAGDVIVALDGAPVPHAHDVPRMVASHAPGARVSVEVRRGAKTLALPVTLGELDDRPPREKKAREERPAPGPLGIELGDASGRGALVQRVAPSGPAAGLLAPGDVIVEVDRQPVKSAADAAERVRRGASGRPILLRVERDGARRWVAIEREGGRG